MKFFPFRTVLFCIILTPLLYVCALLVAEKSLSGYYQKKVEDIYIGDATQLLDGTVTLEDRIGKNIEAFIRGDSGINFAGVEIDITITTEEGKILYPHSEIETPAIGDNRDILVANSSEIARINFQYLNKGIKIKIKASLPYYSVGANIILFLCIVLSMMLFLFFYKRGLKQADHLDAEKRHFIDKLIEEEELNRKKLTDLETEKKSIVEQYQLMKSEYSEISRRATITENEMFEEIVGLEKKLEENIASQKQKEEEINQLREALLLEEKRRGGNKKRKSYDTAAKRFSALYKNIDMNRKALIGFFDLNDEMQIKAEELIHQLNEDFSKVIIKRKVFAGKRNKTASFEVLFSYNGRLYFRNIEGNRIEVLVIGTKNSQDKDMEFLHDLS